jgi:lipopolysaccharide export system protein LptA
MKPALHASLLTKLLFVLLLASGGKAFAEKADRDQPIDLEADTVNVNDAKKISTYTGSVVLTQGSLSIHAEKLIVREDKDGFQHSSSFGNPTTFRQKREGTNDYIQGSAQRIEYDGHLDKVQLYTKAWVKRGDDVIQGDYIMYDASAEYAEVIGGGTQAATADNPKGRVHAVIRPKSKSGANADPAENTTNTGN